MVVLIVSQFLPGENVAYDEIKGVLPLIPRPAAIAAIFCSATPTSKKRSGNFFANSSLFVDSVKSAQSTTTFGSCSPSATRPYPYPVGTISTSLSNIFGFSFKSGFNIAHQNQLILKYFLC